MTTIMKQRKTCCVCGEVGEFIGIGSTNRMGPPDLDTRPPEMMRSTIRYWVQRCVSCGYCAPDVSAGPVEAARVVNSVAYLRQWKDKSRPENANKILCWAMIQEATGDYSGAGWAAVRAAWVCDDAQASSAADECREQALERFQWARNNDMSFADGSGVEEAIMADLLRRSKHFDQVEPVCQDGLAKRPEGIVEKILQFQRALAGREDDRCYTIAQAQDFKQDNMST